MALGTRAGRWLYPREPEGRVVGRYENAEALAAEFSRTFGFPNARVTPGGPDAGIDVVEGHRFVAQVKDWSAPVPIGEVQRLVGAARPHGDPTMAFFATGGYSKKAREYAGPQHVALFILDMGNRSCRPVNQPARVLWQVRVDAAPAAQDRARQPGEQQAAQPPPGTTARELLRAATDGPFGLGNGTYQRATITTPGHRVMTAGTDVTVTRHGGVDVNVQLIRNDQTNAVGWLVDSGSVITHERIVAVSGWASQHRLNAIVFYRFPVSIGSLDTISSTGMRAVWVPDRLGGPWREMDLVARPPGTPGDRGPWLGKPSDAAARTPRAGSGPSFVEHVRSSPFLLLYLAFMVVLAIAIFGHL